MAKTCIGIDGYGIYLGGGALLLGNPSVIVMVNTFPAWLTC